MGLAGQERTMSIPAQRFSALADLVICLFAFNAKRNWSSNESRA